MPIYIPIPIPMPMGPSPEAKFHHQMAHYRNNNEGEVKKIYLLQPMPKAHPQPQLKGGGIIQPARVQTHIHMGFSPQHQVIHSNHNKQPPRVPHNEPSTNHQDDQHQHSSKASKGVSELRILPIVVIPPIAPMPPVQLPPSSNTSSVNQGSIQLPRMTLSPQFNNYLVSAARSTANKDHSASEVEAFSKRPHSPYHMHQDHKSFSDYGGSGGGALYREQSASTPRLRRRSREPIGMRNQMLQREFQASNNRARSYSAPMMKASFDDYGDSDYADYSTVAEAPPSLHLRKSQLHYSRRRRLSQPLEQRRQESWRSAARNSIGDIITEQQSTLFDDEPFDKESETGASGQRSCCHEPAFQNQRSSRMQLNEGDGHLASNSDRESTGGGDNTAHRMRSTDWSGEQNEWLRENGANLAQRRQTQAELNSLYYDRDPVQFDDDPPQQNRPRASFRPLQQHQQQQQQTAIRNHPERDFVVNGDNDEWLFDSIKSVTHLAAGNTTSLSSNNTLTSSTSILKPTPSNWTSNQLNMTRTNQ